MGPLPYLAIGVSIVALGYALAQVIRILRAPYRDAETMPPGPILLPEFRAPYRDAERMSPVPILSPECRPSGHKNFYKRRSRE